MRPHRERAEAESRQQSERERDGARTLRRSRLSRLRSEGPHPFQSFAFSVLPLCPLSLCGSLVLSSPNARAGSFVTKRSRWFFRYPTLEWTPARSNRRRLRFVHPLPHSWQTSLWPGGRV
jgi:hypothetical protein